MARSLPRVLLVSEVAFTKDCRGASRTLLNLFDNYPDKHLLLLSPDQSEPIISQNFLSFRKQHIPNRIDQLFNSILGSINLELHHQLRLPKNEDINQFSPEVIIICPITALGLVIGKKVVQNYKVPFLIYFMDDWIATDTTWWFSGSVSKLSKTILAEASGLLMISEQLEKTLSQRYQLIPKPSMVVHNPVDLLGKEFTAVKATQYRGEYKIVYAGSIWPMHYDALAAIAEAVFHLRQEGENIELVLHTSDYFWSLYRERWESWEVINGSLIPYERLDSFLKRADLLLVASSFLPEYEFMTRSSVQTKITDYMASSRPILSCGPPYSACNKFIKKWACGIVCETDYIPDIKDLLKTRITSTKPDELIARNAFKILAQNFNKKTISQKLYEFIEKIVKEYKYSEQIFKNHMSKQ